MVEKGIGISYPIGKPSNRKGGYTDEERIPHPPPVNEEGIMSIAMRAAVPATIVGLIGLMFARAERSE